MPRRYGIALLLFLTPGIVRAQGTPEDLLPVGAQVYLRWDGIEAHRAAYEKSALGQMLQGDTGKFISGVFAQLQDTLGATLTVQQLLGGAAPEKLQKIQADAAQAPQLLNLLARHGLVLAVEVRRLEPPDGQLTLVVPDAGAQPGPLFATLRLAAALAGAEIKEQKIADRTVSQLQPGGGPVFIAWWVEGKHAVVTLGTESAEAALKRLENKEARLTAAPLLKKLQAFKQFETSARAFIDVAALVKLARTRQEVAGLLDELGLEGLRGLTFYSGFDGVYERGLVEWDMPGPRKGALRLLTGKPFRLTDVPPLPPDVVDWSMTNFNPVIFWDIGVQAAEGVVRLIDPEAVPKVKEVLQQIDNTLGINFRNDFLANLGEQMLSYTSPAEGPLNLGQTFAMRVKDPKKVLEALDQAVKGIAQATGADLSVKKKTYRGTELYEVHFRQEGFFFVPTYAIHKDWLVVGYFPQTVQGFVLRASGELPGWKPDPRLQEALDKLPKEFISIAVSDPVPPITQILSIAPLIAGLFNSFAPDIRLDVGSLPNAHEATRHLFPNVSVITDDGQTLRQQTRASLNLPLNLTGLDTYGIFLFLSLGRAF